MSTSRPVMRIGLVATLVFLAHSQSARAEAQDREAGLLSETEAVARALDASRSLHAARADAEGARASVRAAEGARVPSLSIAAEGYHAEGLAAAGNGIARQQQDGITSSATTVIPTDLGTELGVTLSTGVGWRSTNLDPSRTTVFRIGPLYSGQLTVDVRQPLLRGAGEGATLGPRRQAEASALAAEREAERALSQLALDVLVAHRELWYAQEALTVADEALDLARRQHADAEVRHGELGTVARTEVLRYASQLAAAARARTAAASSVEARAIELGRLVGLSPQASRALRVEASALDPVEPAGHSVLEQAALSSSSELSTLEAQVAAAAERERTAADADQPRVDLIGQLGAGLLFDSDTLGAFQLPEDRPALTGRIGLEVELPLGTSQASAAHAEASFAYDAALARYEARAQEIAARVASLRATLVAAAERIALGTDAEQAARELAEAERQRVLLGTGTALEVLQAQQSERDATLERLRAQADYAEAEAELAHLTGALLRRFAGGAS